MDGTFCAEHNVVNKNPRRAVFFDVIGKSTAPATPRLRVPGWWKRAPAPPPAPSIERREDFDSDSNESTAPIVWRSDGQLIISLGQVGKIVAGAGLCLLLLIAFGLGRRSVATPP